jgi:hypothetical protein
MRSICNLSIGKRHEQQPYDVLAIGVNFATLKGNFMYTTEPMNGLKRSALQT